MREVSTEEITKNIKEMCIEANYTLSDDVKNKIINSAAVEESEIGKKILNQLEENMNIADSDNIPICQDTGMAVIFIKIGQDVHITGGNLEDAINQGVREGYIEGYLRKSVRSSLYAIIWEWKAYRHACDSCPHSSRKS